RCRRPRAHRAARGARRSRAQTRARDASHVIARSAACSWDSARSKMIPSFMAASRRQDAVMDDDVRRAIGLFRFSVLGPLVSARLEHGDRTAYFTEAASRDHVLPPDGRIVRLSPRTIEAWFYLYKRGGFNALVPDAREDKGTTRAIRS